MDIDALHLQAWKHNKLTLVLPTFVDTGMSVSCAYSVSSSGG